MVVGIATGEGFDVGFSTEFGRGSKFWKGGLSGTDPECRVVVGGINFGVAHGIAFRIGTGRAFRMGIGRAFRIRIGVDLGVGSRIPAGMAAGACSIGEVTALASASFRRVASNKFAESAFT